MDTYVERLSFLWLNNEKHGHGTHFTKMGADSLAKNTPNAQIEEFIFQNAAHRPTVYRTGPQSR